MSMPLSGENRSWIRDELAEVQFGDQRLSDRLLTIGERFLERPTVSISRGQQDWAGAKAAYRFFENDKVNARAILQVHAENTSRRIDQVNGPILAIQDTTTLNYNNFPSIEGLSEVGFNPGGRNSVFGFLVHTT